ncbi:hypothetical protein RISK_003865 [Rhodopirellula islandica]|uniref:Uncharacterized protein n=1 Tax=Rhodopirellula islandica TaxID=595434 RepID=A0A0J1EFJ1_RHOIS|nr:hypothetical protein RISK_003865 [Rhodopirellula islandica]
MHVAHQEGPNRRGGGPLHTNFLGLEGMETAASWSKEIHP